MLDARVLAMFTEAVTDLVDDCCDWPVVLMATTTDHRSLSVSLHDLFVHSTHIDVCMSVSLSVCLAVDTLGTQFIKILGIFLSLTEVLL